MQNVALRVDDIGSATKVNEIYGKTRLTIAGISFPFPGNWLFLKYFKPFKCWGPYDELTGREWNLFFDICRKKNVKLTIAVTAGWVESLERIIPFPEKFPDEAEAIKVAVKENLVEIANHGYTHCVLDKNQFRPKWFQGNREFHREFWDWVPYEIQEENIVKSQTILETYFDEKIVTFVPPGNVFSEKTLQIANQYGLKYLSCSGIDKKKIEHLIPISESQVVAFHDKELAENELNWFSELIGVQGDVEFCFIKELGKNFEDKIKI